MGFLRLKMLIDKNMVDTHHRTDLLDKEIISPPRYYIRFGKGEAKPVAHGPVHIGEVVGNQAIIFGLIGGIEIAQHNKGTGFAFDLLGNGRQGLALGFPAVLLDSSWGM